MLKKDVIFIHMKFFFFKSLLHQCYLLIRWLFPLPSALNSNGPFLHKAEVGKWASASTEKN